MADHDVRSLIQEGFGSIHRRIDDFIDVSSTRHQEVVGKIQNVAGEVHAIESRVTRIETRTDAGHALVTYLKWAVGIVGGTIGATIGVLKFLGRL